MAADAPGGPGGPDDPRAPARGRGGIILRMRLPCATLGEVKARHPELVRGRFSFASRTARPVGTAVRLEASLSDGSPCFTARAVLEAVAPAAGGASRWILVLAAADARGRELVSSLGGQPLRPMAEVAPEPAGATPAPAASAPPAPPLRLEPPPPPAPDDPPMLGDDDFAAIDATTGEIALPVPAARQPGPAEAQPAAAAPRAAVAPPPAPRPTDPAPPAATPSPGPSSVRFTPVPRPPPAPAAPPPRLEPAAAQAPAPAPEPEEQPPPARKSGPIIGIDLGTTNSAAAVVKNGKPFVIPSREGYSTIPSVVSLGEKGTLVVGHAAKGRLLTSPHNTVHGAKRLIGRAFASPVVADLQGRLGYPVVAGPRGEAAVKLGEKVYSLQKISAMVLSQVREQAQQWLGEEVGRAVITVPAYYNDNQRQAVREAGALAGLTVERIVNEPTAAAIAFAHGKKHQQKVLVYDLGGGTFDTSLLELHGNVYEVIATGGDTFLGGVDFDRALLDDLLARFREAHGVDFAGDRVAYQRIADAAERAKITLSERLTAEVDVPFVTMVGSQVYALKATVTRAELERHTRALVERTLGVCGEVLATAGVKPGEVGEVLLVGGQSRMPLVRTLVREYFGREPSRSVHPDEAVALGAALLAESIQSGDIGGMVLVDVLPMSIGIGLPGGRMKKIIERNTPLPHRRTHSVWTSGDRQTTLSVPIFQGESDRAQENEYLGTLLVADLPPGARGDVVFDLVFSITAESILTVSAVERGTARTVTATFSTQETPAAVRRRLEGDAAAPGTAPAPAAAAPARPEPSPSLLGRLGRWLGGGKGPKPPAG